MIVEPARLTTFIRADPLSTVAHGALPADSAQAESVPQDGMASHDFAASLVRLSGQGLDLGAAADEPNTGLAASAGASDTSLGQGMEVRVGTAVASAMPLAVPAPQNAVDTNGTPEPEPDDAGMAREVAVLAPSMPVNPVMPVMSVTTSAVTLDASEPAYMPLDTYASRGESPDDAAASHLATMLAAREHRMQGAVGSAQLTERGRGAVDTSTSMSATASAARVGAPMSPPPVGSLPANMTNDDGVAHALRATFSSTLSGSAVATELTAATGMSGLTSLATVSGGTLGGAHAASDGAAVSRTLSERVQSMMENGVQEARMRLMPAELGEIGIVVRKSPMQLSVSLHVARPEVLSLVQGTVGLLRDMLSQRHAGDVHVSIASLPQHGGDGASGNARDRHARDDRAGNASPGLALGAADRNDEVFRP
ncbi:flagellar hook-length control protein FliK [Pandoraea soli]